MTNEVIGIGPLEGWTAQDFFDELKAVRAVVCSCASTAQERQDAITAAMALHLRCGSDQFSEQNNCL